MSNQRIFDAIDGVAVRRDFDRREHDCAFPADRDYWRGRIDAWDEAEKMLRGLLDGDNGG